VTKSGTTAIEPAPTVTADDLGALARDVLARWAH